MADSAAPPKTLLGVAPSLQEAGKRLIDAGELYAILRTLVGVQENILPITSPAVVPLSILPGINVVSAAAAATGVLVLPPASLPGLSVMVVNMGASGITVRPAGSDQITPSDSNTPAATPVTLTNAPTQFVCILPGIWKQVLSA